jgi:hypothetical protein
MSTDEQIDRVQENFRRIYLAGIPCLLNDRGAFLSFLCILTATETLGGFLTPEIDTPKGKKKSPNKTRFMNFVSEYFPDPYPSQVDDLWKLRGAVVHAISPGPYALAHHKSYLHLKQFEGRLILNAEDFFEVLISAAKRYFDELRGNADLQAKFLKKANDPKD